MAAYSSLVKEVLPYVPLCPDSLVEQNLRSATIEFCERSKAYILDIDPFNTISGVYEYDFDIPTGTEVHQVLLMTHDGRDMDPISPRSLELNYPDWRNRTGNPHVYLQKTTFWIVPVPSGSKQVITSVALKPSRTSNNIDTTISNTYRDAIIYGTLYRLLRMPNREWTDIGAAQEYLFQFNVEIQQAELRARGGDLGVKRTVKYKGIGLPRRRYGKYGKEIDY